MASVTGEAAVEQHVPRTASPSTLARAAATLGLVLTLALGGFAALVSVLLLSAGPGETTDSMAWALSLAAVLPLSVAAGLHLSRALERRGTLLATAALGASGLLGLLGLARLAYAIDGGQSFGSPVVLTGLAAWALAFAALVRRGPPSLERLGAAPSRLLALPAALAVGLLLGFVPSRVLGASDVAIAVLASAVLTGGYLALTRLRALGRPAGLIVDLSVLALAALLTNELSVYLDPSRFLAANTVLHQNFFLAPANEVLAGRAMLVDSFSQYGVGAIYVLAAWFSFVPLGFGGLTLLSGVATALEIALLYAIVRLSGASRALGVLLATTAILAANFGQLASQAWYPSTGGLRFGLPVLLIASSTLAAHRPEWNRVLRPAPAVIVGVSAIWSLETFVYCVAALGGIALLRAAEQAINLRSYVRRLLAQLVGPALAMVVAHVAFAVVTRLLAGAWPDWGWYLAFIASYSVDPFLAAPVAPWSPAIAICATYLASGAALAMISVRHRALLDEERPALIAIAGASSFGFATFTYFLSLSFGDRALPVGIAAYLTVALWLGILERRRAAVPAAVRAALVAVPAATLALAVIFASPVIRDRWEYTPLAMAAPDGGEGGSLRHELARMWTSPPLTPELADADRLFRRNMRGGAALVVADPENTAAILVQASRPNLLPVTHFLQDSLVIDRAWPRVARAIDRLRPGTLMLTDPEGLDPAAHYPVELLQRTATRIQRRFVLKPVDSVDAGFSVVRLRARASRGRSGFRGRPLRGPR